jgi:hypothetical protein
LRGWLSGGRTDVLRVFGRRRPPADLGFAPIRCALVAPEPQTWPGAVHVGGIDGYAPIGGEQAIHAVQLIYQHEGRILVMDLSLAAGTSTRIQRPDLDPDLRLAPGLRTLSRLAGSPITLPEQWQSLSRTVCGVSVAIAATPDGAECQQALWVWKDTRVSVASWRVPLDDSWYSNLVTIEANNLKELRVAVRASPLTMRLD